MKKKIDSTLQLAQLMREDSPKWNAIVELIKKEKQSINENVFSRKDDEGNVLTDKQINDLITWHGFLDYVITLPETIIESMKQRPAQEEPDFETYDIGLKPVRDKITNGTD